VNFTYAAISQEQQTKLEKMRQRFLNKLLRITITQTPTKRITLRGLSSALERKLGILSLLVKVVFGNNYFN